jgi:hypothetical protein
MTDSIFSRAFPYRQRESHSPLENYLTEIFAFCLENDLLFRKRFLNDILKIKYTSKDLKIQTQSNYTGLGRPDIEILLDNCAIIIRVRSKQGNG